MSDYFNTIFDNFKTRVTNPFLGTLLIVWIIRNWIFIYSLFSFDDSWTVTNKAKYIQTYFKNYDILYESITNIWVTFAILILTYILLGISRILADCYYRIIEPYIITKFDKNQIFTQVEAERLAKKIDILERRLEKAKTAESSISDEANSLDSQLKTSRSDNEVLTREKNDITSKYDSTKSLLDGLEYQVDNNIANITNINFRNANSAEAFFQSIYQKMDRQLKHDINYISEEDYYSGSSFNSNTTANTKSRLLEYKLIQKEKIGEDYFVTILGHFFFQYVKSKKLKTSITKL